MPTMASGMSGSGGAADVEVVRHPAPRFPGSQLQAGKGGGLSLQNRHYHAEGHEVRTMAGLEGAET
jgi:hypothetical protein